VQDAILDKMEFWLPFVEVRDIKVLSKNSSTDIGVNEVIVKILFNIKQDPNTLDSVSLNSPYPYDQVLYQNVPIFKLRIGTHFMCGDKNVFLSNNMSTGSMKYLVPILSNILLNNYKLKIKKPIMVDGGFNFNFEILKVKYSVKRYNDFKGVIHMERFSNFFISRGLNPFSVDKKLWIENRFKYNLNKMKNDKETLIKYSLILQDNNIHDDFLNTSTINLMFL
jgi:hypothetical protein